MCKMCMRNVLDDIHPVITITFCFRDGLMIYINHGEVYEIEFHRKKSADVYTRLGNGKKRTNKYKSVSVSASNITNFLDSEPRKNNVRRVTGYCIRGDSGENWLSDVNMLTSFISSKIKDGLYKKIIELFCLPRLKWEILSHKLNDVVKYHDLSSSHVKLNIKIDSELNKLKIDLIYNKNKYKNRQRVIKDTLEKFLPYDTIQCLFLYLDWW